MLCGAKIALNTTQSSQSIMSEEVGPDVEEISRMQGEISSLQKEMEKIRGSYENIAATTTTNDGSSTRIYTNNVKH